MEKKYNKSLPCSFFSCSKFGSGILCDGGFFSCWGMIGDNRITTNITRGKCTENGISLDLVANRISSFPLDKFSDLEKRNYVYLDYTDLNRKIPDIDSFEHIKECYWENGGWICSYFSPNCYLQWPDPFPGKKPMKINASGLPTPWPISLVNAGLAFLGIITANDEINFLTQSSVIFTTTRCSIALIGSWFALGILSLNGFQYPELAWLASFSTTIYFITFREKVIDLLVKTWKFFWRASERVLSICDCTSNNIIYRQCQLCCFSIIFCYVIIPMFSILLAISLTLAFNVISPPISYLWNIVSLGVHSGFYNFPKSAQFVTSCTKIPVTSWHTIAQCVPKSNGFSCLLGSKDIRIMDIFIRSLGALLPLTYFWVVPKLKNRLNARENQDNNDIEMSNYGEDGIQSPNTNRQRKNLIKAIKTWAGVIICVVSGIYLVTMASIQAKGLNTTGLEVCEVNQELTSSKTGYLWVVMNVNVISRKK